MQNLTTFSWTKFLRNCLNQSCSSFSSIGFSGLQAYLNLCCARWHCWYFLQKLKCDSARSLQTWQRLCVCSPHQRDRSVHSEHQLIRWITTTVFPDVRYNLLFTIPSPLKAVFTLWHRFMCMFKCIVRVPERSKKNQKSYWSLGSTSPPSLLRKLLWGKLWFGGMLVSVEVGVMVIMEQNGSYLGPGVFSPTWNLN